MVGRSELIAKLKSFEEAATAISGLWCECDDKKLLKALATNYPFRHELDEVAYDIMLWTQTATALIEDIGL